MHGRACCLRSIDMDDISTTLFLTCRLFVSEMSVSLLLYGRKSGMASMIGRHANSSAWRTLPLPRTTC